jgi:predicted DNA-binding protein
VRQTTIRLTDELDIAIERESKQAGISKGELMRHAIVHYLTWLEAIRQGKPGQTPQQHPRGDA